ncbi:hypothetical protein ACHAXS_000726 [Conticribra weissflogii]
MAAFDKSRIYAHSIKISYENNIHYQSSPICLTESPDTSSLLNLTFPCNITHLNSMNQVKNFVSLSHPSANTNTNAYQWVSNVPLTLPSKSWRKFYAMSKTPAFILMTLVHFPSRGNTICCYLTKSYIG